MTTATEKKSLSAINIFFLLFMIGAILFAAWTGTPSALTEEGQEPLNRMQAITDASFDAAKAAVNLAIGLIGIMALWLGLVRILEAGGFMFTIARLVRPVMQRLFPDVPGEHPAMSAMILNVSANMLGLGNAATPFGIKAMVELDKLNPVKGTATNAMCLFLAINTSSITLLPLGVIGVRAAAGSTEPASIFLPTIIATLCSTVVAVTIATLLSRLDNKYAESTESTTVTKTSDQSEASSGSGEKVNDSPEEFEHLLADPHPIGKLLAWLSVLAFFAAAVYQGIRVARFNPDAYFFTKDFLTYWLMPFLMLLIVVYGLGRGVRVYEAVTEGAKQGFEIAIRIIPFLVAILVAIAMFRASGAMELLVSALQPVTQLIGMPAEALPMAVVRPLSGSGAFAVMSDLVQKDPDSYTSFVASTMMGSTETTFYVLAVYFGAVGVTRIRHALIAALCADLTGLVVSCLACAAIWSG